MTYREAVDLVSTVAEALHYAHKQGLVHRDVKPGNILLGSDGTAYVVDFGMALKEQDIGKGPEYAGTPAYMSPEQARGEGHRVDGRSDIYSLGVVLYELLVGRRTFQAGTMAELLKQITTLEVKPPRQIDDSVPKELERICLKALSRRASDRYTTALDMSMALRHPDKYAGAIAMSVAGRPIRVDQPKTADLDLSESRFYLAAGQGEMSGMKKYMKRVETWLAKQGAQCKQSRPPGNHDLDVWTEEFNSAVRWLFC